MMSATQQPLQTIEANLATLLHGVAQPSAIASAIVAEHIRASLYGILAANTARTIHTTGLLSNARRTLTLTWPDSSRDLESMAATGIKDFSTNILDRLRQLGDAWQVGNGQWISTPLRLVVLGTSPRCLVVGTAPLSLAEHRLKVTIACTGASRFADRARVTDKFLDQTVDAWLGIVSPLEDWTNQILGASASRMQHVGGLAVDQLEIYAPDVLRSQRRTGRWIAVGDVARALPEMRLCRPKLQYARFNRPYYLAHFAFKNGSLLLQHQAPVPSDISLRLRFGLDIRLATPRRLAIALGESTFTIDKPLQLPDPDSRVLALGWPDHYGDAATERLTFHNDALPFVLHALKRLAVDPIIARRSQT